jgi:ABC-type antimicrobial peptide transport system permease subunit
MVALASSALLLSAVGLYGVISYLTALRNREIGVRVALGAGTVQILRMVAWDGVVMAAPGILLGVGGSLLLGRLVESLLWQVQPNDPLTITGVLVLLMAVLAVATLLPALRAAKTDPAVVLREE